jgi:DNA-binding beta-propeller fold protein YncE
MVKLVDIDFRISAIPAAVFCLLFLSSCAEPQRQMVLDSGAGEDVQRRTWPGSPEVPRYTYAGQLTGEDNFPQVKQTRKGAVAALAWLVGLGQEKEEPVVLQRPQGGTVDAEGRIYVTDVSRQAVFVFDPSEAKLHVWEFDEDRKRFLAPIGITMGPRNEILVADAELGAVFRLDRDGSPLGSFGSDVLKRPTGLAYDAGRSLIYVADTRGNDIKVFDESGRLTDFIGRSGESAGELNAPTYVAFADDRIYVTDTLNSRVQVFDREGDSLNVFGARGLFVGNLARPKGITVDDEGNIYVIESYYDHLLVYDREGRFLLPIGGTGNAPGQFYLPSGVWADGDNRIYVADMFNGRVSIFQFLGDY